MYTDGFYYIETIFASQNGRLLKKGAKMLKGKRYPAGFKAHQMNGSGFYYVEVVFEVDF